MTLLDINSNPIIKTNPDYNNSIEIIIDEESIDEVAIIQTATLLELEMIELKIEVERLKTLTGYNEGQRIKNRKKCNII
jgi:hypothetical protein